MPLQPKSAARQKCAAWGNRPLPPSLATLLRRSILLVKGRASAGKELNQTIKVAPLLSEELPLLNDTNLLHQVKFRPYSDPIHTYPFLFENENFSLRIAFLSTRIRRIRSRKPELFKHAFQNRRFENGTLQKRPGYGVVSCARFEQRTDVSRLCRFCLGFC